MGTIKKLFNVKLEAVKTRSLEDILLSFVDIREDLFDFCDEAGAEIASNKAQIEELTQKNNELTREREQALAVIKNIGKLLGE